MRLKSTVAAWLAAPLFACAPAGAWADTGPCATNIGAALPDLIVNAKKLLQYLSVSEEKYSNASCAVQEGFVSGPGQHTLLRFATATPNIGAGALVIGDPNLCTPLFELSSCHGHYHFREYADYRLWTPQGYDTWVAVRDLAQPASGGSNGAALARAIKDRSLVIGRKMGFCMIDTDPYDLLANPNPTYISCSNGQGISVGWQDTYGPALDGQYVQIDRLKSGDYVLEVHVNPELVLPESNTLNNSTAIRIRYAERRGSLPPSVVVLP